jgi:hypothetical protein
VCDSWLENDRAMAAVTSTTAGAPATGAAKGVSYPEIYTTEDGLRKLGSHLRSLHGVKVRSGIEHDKRVEYFKGHGASVVLAAHRLFVGKRLIECLLEAQNWPKALPKITDKGMALELAAALLLKGFFHRSEKSPDKKGHLIVRLSCFHPAPHSPSLPLPPSDRSPPRRCLRRPATSPGCTVAT